MSVYDVIRFPHITEKSTLQSETGEQQCVAFKVRVDASKHQVKEAVEKVFDVKVDQVRTARFQGKMKRQGRNQGRRPAWKKAYITLKPGHKIEFFEGV
ncbi:MAG: 50S ribosomal protein L23 [Acidobacteriota bacterium]|nr:MAG: 50S ribosomal protein L23 [Acidobacteriota bacterium]